MNRKDQEAAKVEISKETIRQFIGGDLTAFRTIFRAAVSEVYWLAYRILGNKDAAEDVVQETFTRIYEMRKQLDPEKSFHALVLRVATNLSIDQWRKTQREKWVPYPEETEGTAEQFAAFPDGAEEKESRQLDIHEALETLPAIYRAALILKYGHDLSYQEIAETLHISVPAVALRLKRGKEFLREKLSGTINQENY